MQMVGEREAHVKEAPAHTEIKVDTEETSVREGAADGDRGAGANNQDFRVVPRMWPAIAGERTLDVGCGLGLYTMEMNRRGARAVGLEVNLDALRQAQRLNRGERVGWIVGDAQRLPFRDRSFQLIVSVEVLSHLSPESRARTADEIARVTAERGNAVITLHNRRRLTVASWLRLRRASQKYETSNLSVWPTVPKLALALFSTRGFAAAGKSRYVNYHSRFTHAFYQRHPRLSGCLMLLEDLLSASPIFKQLGITFAISLKRVAVNDR